VPPHLAETVLAIEDRRFREHGGVDPRGTLRAHLRNVAAECVEEGGSTIAQLLVEVLDLDPERTNRRRLQEVALATALERQVGKVRIMELYRNAVHLDSGAHGMPAAELLLPEAAMLSATIQAPSRVNSLADLGGAQNRGASVLSLMAERQRISDEKCDRALVQVATLVPPPPLARTGSDFVKWVLAEAETLDGESSLSLAATATLGPALRRRAEWIVARVIAADGPAARASQAVIVVMTPGG
jgi:membrane peptidoglycan carboxypeptidase